MKPYSEPATNTIYNMLFCDDLSLFHATGDAAKEYPWNILLSAESSNEDVEKVMRDAKLESRLRLLAANQLKQRNVNDLPKWLLGVVVELGLEDGLDVLAAYKDGTARYINYTGSMVIWEAYTHQSMAITNKLFEASENIVNQIGPWNQPRRPYPMQQNMRISFLCTDALYFGEGPINVLFNDPMAAPALQAATEFLQLVTSKS